MRRVHKTLWLLAGSAALLSGCATYPYDGPYTYDERYTDNRVVYDSRYDSRPYRYYDYDYAYSRPYYYSPPVYVQPSLSLGFGYSRGWRYR
jgi:hypothetical protein